MNFWYFLYNINAFIYSNGKYYLNSLWIPNDIKIFIMFRLYKYQPIINIYLSYVIILMIRKWLYSLIFRIFNYYVHLTTYLINMRIWKTSFLIHDKIQKYFLLELYPFKKLSSKLFNQHPLNYFFLN